MSLTVHIDDVHDEYGIAHRGYLIFITSGISFFKKVDLNGSSCDGPINSQINDSY